jgi:hypothetical protein
MSTSNKKIKDLLKLLKIVEDKLNPYYPVYEITADFDARSIVDVRSIVFNIIQNQNWTDTLNDELYEINELLEKIYSSSSGDSIRTSLLEAYTYVQNMTNIPHYVKDPKPCGEQSDFFIPNTLNKCYTLLQCIDANIEFVIHLINQQLEMVHYQFYGPHEFYGPEPEDFTTYEQLQASYLTERIPYLKLRTEFKKKNCLLTLFLSIRHFIIMNEPYFVLFKIIKILVNKSISENVVVFTHLYRNVGNEPNKIIQNFLRDDIFTNYENTDAWNTMMHNNSNITPTTPLRLLDLKQFLHLLEEEDSTSETRVVRSRSSRQKKVSASTTNIESSSMPTSRDITKKQYTSWLPSIRLSSTTRKKLSGQESSSMPTSRDITKKQYTSWLPSWLPSIIRKKLSGQELGSISHNPMFQMSTSRNTTEKQDTSGLLPTHHNKSTKEDQSSNSYNQMLPRLSRPISGNKVVLPPIETNKSTDNKSTNNKSTKKKGGSFKGFLKSILPKTKGSPKSGGKKTKKRRPKK